MSVPASILRSLTLCLQSWAWEDTHYRCASLAKRHSLMIKWCGESKRKQKHRGSLAAAKNSAMSPGCPITAQMPVAGVLEQRMTLTPGFLRDTQSGPDRRGRGGGNWGQAMLRSRGGRRRTCRLEGDGEGQTADSATECMLCTEKGRASGTWGKS